MNKDMVVRSDGVARRRECVREPRMSSTMNEYKLQKDLKNDRLALRNTSVSI